MPRRELRYKYDRITCEEEIPEMRIDMTNIGVAHEDHENTERYGWRNMHEKLREVEKS